MSFDIGITRNDHININGYGLIAVISIGMSDNVAGKKALSEVIRFDFTNPVIISNNEAPKAVNVVPDSIKAYDNNTRISPQANRYMKDWSIYPNPAHKDHVSHFTFYLEQKQKVFTGLTGRSLWHKQKKFPAGEHKILLPTGNFDPGIYMIRLRSADQQIATKWIITQ